MERKRATIVDIVPEHKTGNTGDKYLLQGDDCEFYVALSRRTNIEISSLRKGVKVVIECTLGDVDYTDEHYPTYSRAKIISMI